MNLKQILIALCATSWITSCTKQTSLQEDSIPIYNILLDVNQNPTVPYDSLVRHIEYIPQPFSHAKNTDIFLSRTAFRLIDDIFHTSDI